jgi:hypothetical protein
LHDIAFDNFCLLIFKPLDIVHFESSPLPPKRTVSSFFRDHRGVSPVPICYRS